MGADEAAKRKWLRVADWSKPEIETDVCPRDESVTLIERKISCTPVGKYRPQFHIGQLSVLVPDVSISRLIADVDET